MSVPAVWLVGSYMVGAMTYGAALSLSGDISVKCLILTLAITPFSKMMTSSGWVKAMIPLRRTFGVASFCYATLHVMIYLLRKMDVSIIVSEGLTLEILTGWFAFFIFIPLAVTSRNVWIRRLKQNWKRLHVWAYPAAILVCAHWILTAFDPLMGIIHSAVIVLLLAWRVYSIRQT